MAKMSEQARRKKIEQMVRARDGAKRAYALVDKLLDELLAGGMKAGDVVALASGRRAEMVDNFAAKNKYFKSAGVARFDIVVSHDPSD